MAHPYAQHKGKHPHHSHRVKKLFGHMADGGKVTEKDKGLVKEIIDVHRKEHKMIHADQKACGGKAMPRMDKYARGGKVKSKGHHTKINIIVAPKGGDHAGSPPMMPPPGGPPPGAGAPPPMSPKAPMAPPPNPMAGGMPGMGGPPGMKHGGKVRPRSGISSPKNLKEWANYASSNTRYAEGGKVTKYTAGAGTGEGRKQKIAHYGKRARGN